MHKTIRLVCLLIFIAPPLLAVEPDRTPNDSNFPAAGDWPWWRGPTQNGMAAAQQQLPLEWSDTQNVSWKVPIVGRGHGSPTVVDDQVFLATADEAEGTQSVICFDRASGKVQWNTIVHSGKLMTGKGNKKATQASSTVACDGERLFINFPNAGAVYTTCLSRAGKILWQTKISDYVVHQGYGSSPAIYQSLVIVSADNKGGGAIAGLDRESGKIVWQHSRPKQPNYASPVIVHADGRDQLIFTGCDLVSSYQPLTGEKLWEIKGATTECVTSTVTNGELVYSSGGYPKNHLAAIRADGSGKIAWENTTRVYVPSFVIKGDYLYAATDNGIAMCWNASTGEEMWKSRLGGTFTSSAVLVGDNVLAGNESGEWFVFKANPDKFELVAENKLGDQVYATPVMAGGVIFARVVENGKGGRQEVLYAIGGGR